VSRLRELKEKRMLVLDKILSDMPLCKLLYYDTEHPLDKQDISDTSTLLFDRIFPLPYTDMTQDTTGSLLNFFFSEIVSEGLKFKEIKLKFIISCHYSSWTNMENGDLRADAISERIDELFNETRNLGIGKVLFESRREIYPADKFAGYIMTYKVTDFN
jgi:hypothetical protein